MKKLVSILMTGLVITNQIACAGKVTKISTPLDKVKFEKNYKYAFKFKGGGETAPIPGDQIQTNKDQVIIKTKTEKKSLLAQDIKKIDGVGTQSTGSNAVQGTIIGSLVVGISTFLALGMVRSLQTMGDSDGQDAVNVPLGAGIGFAAGALIGYGIGVTHPKHSRVQITPLVEPTSSGINAGGNLQVNF